MGGDVFSKADAAVSSSAGGGGQWAPTSRLCPPNHCIPKYCPRRERGEDKENVSPNTKKKLVNLARELGDTLTAGNHDLAPQKDSKLLQHQKRKAAKKSKK